MIDIRAVAAGEQPQLRELRLRALNDAPAAFAATAQEESGYPEWRWSELAASSGDELCVYVAIDGRQWVGMAGVRWFDHDRGITQLWGMWVQPGRRGEGIGERLVDAVRAWAREHEARFLRLGVIGETAAAAGFYARLGFVDTGERKPLVRDPARICVFMARPA